MWTDLQPTIDFIELDDRKEDYGVVNPHVVVVPNRTSPSQKHFGQLAEALEEVNAIMAPPISDLSIARSHSSEFQGVGALPEHASVPRSNGLASSSSIT